MKVLLLALLANAALLALPAHARVWTAPEGCEIFLTVQAKACRVSNHYRCAGDAPGDQWRADFDQEGLFFTSRINFETEWVESFEIFPKDRQVLMSNPADPANFSELLSSGVDHFAFELDRDSGLRTSVSGFDRLTGKDVTIDGLTLKETEFDFTELDASGNEYRRARGLEYVSPEYRLFFAGPGEVMIDGEWLPIDGSPVSFATPAEPGFGASQPIYECDALTAQAPLMMKVPVIPASFNPASPEE